MGSVNAAFNAQLAQKRLDAASAVAAAFHNRHVDVQRELLRLAGVEVIDALEDLRGQPELNVDSRDALERARALIDQARAEPSPVFRLTAIRAAREAIELGNARLGTNLTFAIGDGTVMF